MSLLSTFLSLLSSPSLSFSFQKEHLFVVHLEALSGYEHGIARIHHTVLSKIISLLWKVKDVLFCKALRKKTKTMKRRDSMQESPGRESENATVDVSERERESTREKKEERGSGV